MKHDILNYLNEKIGEIELPDDTPEAVVLEKLARYAAPPPAEVIVDVSPRQIRQALILSGVPLATITDALATLPEPTKSLAQVEWEYATVFERSRPLVAEVGVLLGWSSDQLDAIWKFAATL